MGPRDGITEYGGRYASAYLGDVFTKDRFSLNVGARWDLRTARNLASEAPANDAFPSLLPALQYQGQDDNAIEWNDLSPRLGLSYALDQGRRTVLCASFARYATHLSFGNVTWDLRTARKAVAAGILAYGWNDRNGDRMVQPNEVDLGRSGARADPC